LSADNATVQFMVLGYSRQSMYLRDMMFPFRVDLLDFIRAGGLASDKSCIYTESQKGRPHWHPKSQWQSINTQQCVCLILEEQHEPPHPKRLCQRFAVVGAR
jgi:hypothetical protein